MIDVAKIQPWTVCLIVLAKQYLQSEPLLPHNTNTSVPGSKIAIQLSLKLGMLGVIFFCLIISTFSSLITQHSPDIAFVKFPGASALLNIFFLVFFI